jgi:hypothetical protein
LLTPVLTAVPSAPMTQIDSSDSVVVMNLLIISLAISKAFPLAGSK